MPDSWTAGPNQNQICHASDAPSSWQLPITAEATALAHSFLPLRPINTQTQRSRWHLTITCSSPSCSSLRQSRLSSCQDGPHYEAIPPYRCNELFSWWRSKLSGRALISRFCFLLISHLPSCSWREQSLVSRTSTHFLRAFLPCIALHRQPGFILHSWSRTIPLQLVRKASLAAAALISFI